MKKRFVASRVVVIFVAFANKHQNKIPSLQISFDQSLMGTDGVHVWNAPSKNEAFLIAALMACLNATDLSWRNDGACAAASAARWPTPASPLEVELNGTVWVPVALQPAKPNPAQATNNVVTVQLPEVISPDTGKPIALEYTGVRYAWCVVFVLPLRRPQRVNEER